MRSSTNFALTGARLAAEYYRLTGKPLGVTGEVAEYVAAETLGLVLADARPALVKSVDLPESMLIVTPRGRGVPVPSFAPSSETSAKCLDVRGGRIPPHAAQSPSSECRLMPTSVL